MADNSTILEKLDGLVARFEEISTLITDPAVIADQKRYVKLTKEYKELDDLMKARKEYMQLLGNIEEARNILANESDADMREMAKEEMDSSQERLPVLDEEINLMLVPAVLSTAVIYFLSPALSYWWLLPVLLGCFVAANLVYVLLMFVCSLFAGPNRMYDRISPFYLALTLALDGWILALCRIKIHVEGLERFRRIRSFSS